MSHLINTWVGTINNLRITNWEVLKHPWRKWLHKYYHIIIRNLCLWIYELIVEENLVFSPLRQQCNKMSGSLFLILSKVSQAKWREWEDKILVDLMPKSINAYQITGWVLLKSILVTYTWHKLFCAWGSSGHRKIFLVVWVLVWNNWGGGCFRYSGPECIFQLEMVWGENGEKSFLVFCANNVCQ